MLNIKNILVPTDFSTCAEAAIMHALHLAQACEAEVHLLHVIENVLDANNYHGYSEVSAKYARLLESANGHGGEQGKSLGEWNDVPLQRITRRSSEAAPVILEYIRDQDIDLVVMGTHGHRSVDRFLSDVADHWLIGKTTDLVLTQSGCPVFTVGPRGCNQMPELVKRILVPLDFSEHARHALIHAKYVAALYGAGLGLLHVLEDEHILEGTPIHARMQFFFGATSGPEVDVHYHVAEGQPGRVISDYARRHQAHMVVLSSHGQKGLKQVRLGREASLIVRAAPCPVFTVKSFGKLLTFPKA